MATVQIRDVPDEVHKALVRQAELRGQSLNKYLLERLREVARMGRNREVFERSHARLAGAKLPTSAQIVESVRAIRDAPDKV
jgi:hypothetical protein